jgi:ATP phosphoribosyltransferase
VDTGRRFESQAAKTLAARHLQTRIQNVCRLGVDRLTIAIPSKGRLREPAWALLEATGLAPEEAGLRALTAHCRNAPVEILFVHAEDVPEYVQDGVVDCGITGLDLVRERECAVDVLLPLDFGFCGLEAAVPAEDPATRFVDLAGRRIATAHPRLAQAALGELGIKAQIVRVTGSVEIAPRLGLAEAIIDLVSSGNTLRTNGLRSLGTLFPSQAVLVGRSGQGSATLRTLATMLGSVVDARASRYLMCNAPVEAVASIAAILPTEGSPSVIPLARPDVVAMHALVPAASVWQLLPSLEELGASSILILPVERMLR